MNSIIPLNIRLLGDAGVGKTNLIRRFRRNPFEKRYVTTIGHEVSPIGIMTNHGTYLIHFYDTAGQEKYSTPPPKDTIYNATLLVYDNRRITGNGLSKWFTQCENEPVMIIRTKSDVDLTDIDNKIPALLESNPEFPHWHVSTKSDDLKGLLRDILRQITGNSDLEILENNTFMPSS